MQVGNRTVYNAFTFMGNVNYTLANAIAGDLRALVASTKAYFRPGSPTDETKITYIVVKESETAGSIVIPEPLLDLDSLALAGNEIFDVVVRDKVTQQQLQQILTGNGLKDFAINVRQV
jgi:hypothetical protein